MIYMEQKVEDFLKDLTDNEIFDIDFHLGSEIKRRIVELLKKHGCTSVYLSEDSDVGISVNDSYGTHRWEEDELDRWVNVREAGYIDVFEGGKVYHDILYIITDKNEQYSDEELNNYSIWDLYKAIKEVFEKDYSNDNSK